MTGIIGIVFGFAFLILAFVLEKGNPAKLVSLTPAMIVFGGTISAVVISFPIQTVKKVGKVLKVAFASKPRDMVSLIVYFKELAFKTRKNGLLSIEGEIGDANMDPFVKKGLQMIVDGVEPQTVRGILELETEMMSERHKNCVALFESAGGYSPTMGVIGTVMSLVVVLGGLASSDTAALGEKISTAFIATLYGVGFANLVWLPIGNRLKEINKEEEVEKNLITEAVLLIQEGVNPNTIAEKLKSFLGKEELVKFESMDKKVE